MTITQKIKLRSRSFKIHLKELGGLWKTCKYFFEKHILTKEELRLIIKGKQFPIYLRNSTSDISIFAQIFINKDFEDGIKDIYSPEVIIDCGANIGLATLYFQYRYPEAFIYSLEPEPSNYILLKKNVSSYNNIQTFEKALWSGSERLKLKINTEKDSFYVSESTEKNTINIEAVSLNDFIKENCINQIDLLKIDIEGSELPLFKSNLEWLAKTDVIILEIHERINPGSTAYINNLLSDSFSISYTGEYIKYSRKNQFKRHTVEKHGREV